MALKLTKDEMSRLPAWAKQQIAEQSTEKEQEVYKQYLQEPYEKYLKRPYSKYLWECYNPPMRIMQPNDVRTETVWGYMSVVWWSIISFWGFQILFVIGFCTKTPILVRIM
ncbi:MAG: hypothetical protein SOT71_07885 [Romboutsia timonensis]|uniref:hypothetical protein n=1 Tax=Romboutsia timonensis TaxID=1776391 RepID=UPI002A7619C3|nr:hypothetical protein [Romboutsia timonensis]MDY2882557.1 hypothetical protein [Romboutsia timonensis]